MNDFNQFEDPIIILRGTSLIYNDSSQSPKKYTTPLPFPEFLLYFQHETTTAARSDGLWGRLVPHRGNCVVEPCHPAGITGRRQPDM